MLWNRASIGKKIFFAITLTSAAIVLIMAGMISVSMGNGFARYLAQAEINRFDVLEKALAETHRSEKPGWPELAVTRRAWANFIGQHFQPERPRQNPNRPSRNGQPPPRLGDPLGIATRLSLLGADGQFIIGSRNRKSYVATRPIMAMGADANSQPLGWIALFQPRGAVEAADDFFLEGQFRALMVAALVALVLSAIAAWFLARQFLAPIRTIADGAKELAAGNYAMRLSDTRRDELGDLITNYNALANGLEAAASAERIWITNTSHELQTPLAILRAEIEALQDGVRKPTKNVLAGLHASVMRLSHLVNDVNTLSRTQEGGFSLSFETCNLVDIINASVDQARPRISNSGLSIKVLSQPDLYLKCDENRILQLIDNLLENASRYTDAPGEILVRAINDHNAISLVVEDSAPCPPTETLSRLFERFYRVEGSRSREHGGSGLGLAICKTIAEAHGGTLHATRSSLGGLRVELLLPTIGRKITNTGSEQK